MSNLCDCDCIGHSRHLTAGARQSTTLFVRRIKRQFFIGMQITDTGRYRLDIDSALGELFITNGLLCRWLMPLSRCWTLCVLCYLVAVVGAEHRLTAE